MSCQGIHPTRSRWRRRFCPVGGGGAATPAPRRRQPRRRWRLARSLRVRHGLVASSRERTTMRQTSRLSSPLSLPLARAALRAPAPSCGRLRSAARRARRRDRRPTRTRPSPARRTANARDPVLLGVRPSRHGVEIWPGGGWYTEILATTWPKRRHLLGGGPQRRAARGGAPAHRGQRRVYGHARLATFRLSRRARPRCPTVRTTSSQLRNVHNWRMGYHGRQCDYAEDFAQMFRMLRPGGTRASSTPAPREASDEPSGPAAISRSRPCGARRSGGLTPRRLAEVNANPADTATGRAALDAPARIPPRRQDRTATRHRRKRPQTLRFVKPR